MGGGAAPQRQPLRACRRHRSLTGGKMQRRRKAHNGRYAHVCAAVVGGVLSAVLRLLWRVSGALLGVSLRTPRGAAPP